MAHIASFMVESSVNVGLNNLIARELSPDSYKSSGSSRSNTSDTAPTTSTSTPTEETEKYVWRLHQPTEARKFTLFPSKDKLPSTSTAANVRKVSDPEIAADGKGSLRSKASQQSLVRRRKISVSELGPMTTVQEIPMDSPTIPGRPPLHERSTSAPGNTWRQHMFGESMIQCISGPALDENAEVLMRTSSHSRTLSSSPKLPPFPTKALAPLIIPQVNVSGYLRPQGSSSRLRPEYDSDTPPDVPPKSARMQNPSPHSRAPFTPASSTSTLVNTPALHEDGRASPMPSATSSAAPSPMGRQRGQSDAARRTSSQSTGHRRGESESAVSIMDRGRPKKRSDGSPIKPARQRSKSAEQKAFATLPQGKRPTVVGTAIPSPELDIIRKQAMGQASRFEVLTIKDVDTLSRELRALDERCDYLRRTHKSLRAGRRNLHDRICSYLRSPRVARFSHESILKQEEALSELDTSIDDWVSKLEYAENRRTRVRQKLLEHVAAALILPSAEQNAPQQPPQSHTPTLNALTTPPRSPTKAQSPQRLAAPVKVVSPEPRSRKDICSQASMASIKIYADSDVYALLADVEEEIARMGDQTVQGSQPQRDASPTVSEGPTLSSMAFKGNYSRHAQST